MKSASSLSTHKETPESSERGIPAIHMMKLTKDGRTVLTGDDYQRLRQQKAKDADYECEWCAQRATSHGAFQGELHHLEGRGGGKRDDTVAGTVWICSNCHEQEHRPPIKTRIQNEDSIMPHDKNGLVLEVGDEVIVRCKIRSIAPGDDYCNLALDTVEKMFPGENISGMSLNAKQVEKVISAPEQPAEPPSGAGVGG